MSKQSFHYCLRLAIWMAHDKRSGYEDKPILFKDMEIDHIIPRRVLYNPKEQNEIEKWRSKYSLDPDFDIDGIENLCPSTRSFNLRKSDKGLYDDIFKSYIIKALIKAKQLKPKIQELNEKYKREFDARRIKAKITDINAIKQLIEEKTIDIKDVIESIDSTISYEDFTRINEKKKYDKILEKYRVYGIRFFNYGEYLEIKDCIRFSVENQLGEENFWINKIDEFNKNIENSILKKRLFYEKAFAMFKTKMEWTSIEVELLEYFESIINEKNLEVLGQSVNLFNVFYGELQGNRLKSKPLKVLEIRKMLLKSLDSKIENSETQSRIIQLKFRKIMLNFGVNQEDIVKINGIVDQENTNKAWADRVIQEFIEFTQLIETPQYFDLNNYFNLIKALSENIPAIENHFEFDNLFEKITTLKENYNTNNSVIKHLMEKAIRLFEGGLYLRSIEQFQKIITKAFNPDKIYDCIFAYYYTGLCFERIGLLFASKYYFLTAFYLANEIDSDYITKQLTYDCGMDNIAQINFKLSHTKEAILSTMNSLMLRAYYSSSIIDFSDNKNPQNRNINTLFNFIIQDYLYEKFYGVEEKLNQLVSLLDKFGVLDIIERSINSLTLETKKTFAKKITPKTHRILIDIEKDRSYSWKQLGANWTVKWDTGEVPIPISEEFISYIQIILFNLRDMDISFINDSVTIRLLISEDIGYVGFQEGDIHIVNLSQNIKYSSYAQNISKILSTLYLIITKNAIVSREQFYNEIERIFKDNYLSNSYQYIWNNSFGSLKID